LSSLLEAIFLTVNEWMVSGTAIAALGCFAWGMISVLFSPCHLASIPLIVAYVGGQEKALNPKQAGVYSTLFALGLFISIALIGIVCALAIFLIIKFLGNVHFQFFQKTLMTCHSSCVIKISAYF